jgi:putative transcriptional regulator
MPPPVPRPVPPFAGSDGGPPGLAGLRRSGAVTELLFLFECATLEPTQLKPVADRLGLTVQAASHVSRALRARGLLAIRDGRYRPTVEGVAWLHGGLGRVAEDIRRRLGQLNVVRSCRALAGSTLRTGDAVSLEIRDGLLSARRGSSGASRGRVIRGGPAGSLVEVGELEGIVPLSPQPVKIRTLSDSDLDDPALKRRLGTELPGREGVVAADGLEAYHAVRRTTDRPVVRFAPAEVSLEAARIGVPTLLVTLERDLPHLLARFGGSDLPPLDVLPLAGARRAVGRRGGRDSGRKRA